MGKILDGTQPDMSPLVEALKEQRGEPLDLQFMTDLVRRLQATPKGRRLLAWGMAVASEEWADAQP